MPGSESTFHLMMKIWTKVKKALTNVWRKLRVVDVIGAALAILKAAKREGSGIDKKYIVVKPRILSDHNLLRGVAALKAVLAFIPPRLWRRLFWVWVRWVSKYGNELP